MVKVETTCSYCGVVIYRQPYELKRSKNVFCCNEHKYLWNSETNKGRVVKFRGDPVEFECLNCSKKFKVKYSKAIKLGAKFCCLDCKHEYNRNNHTRVTSKCSWCGTDIEVSKDRNGRCNLHFCDDDCFHAYKNYMNEMELSGKVVRTCPECGEKFDIYVSLTKNVHHNFCSIKCKDNYRAKYYIGENAPSWKGVEYYHNGRHYSCMNPRNRDMVREYFSRKCCICGKDESISRKLNVHHIYPDEISIPFVDTYFIAVCASCHNMIHNDDELMNNIIDEVELKSYIYKGDFIKEVMGYFYG